MSKFKVGDEVIFLSGTNSQFISPGSIGIVEAVRNDYLNAVWKQKKRKHLNGQYQDGTWSCTFDEIDLAQPYLNELKLKKALGIK